MPLILAGFSWLGGFLASLGGAAAFWFAKYITKRLLVIGVALAAAGVATGIFYVALQALIDSLAQSAPSWVGLASSLFLPDNIHECVTAIISAHIARLVYVWRYRAIFAKANVSFGG